MTVQRLTSKRPNFFGVGKLGLIFSLFFVFCAKGVQIDPPVMVPSAKVSPRYMSVAIVCTTPDVTIRYTLDGSQPLVTSAVYSEPIPLGSSTTILARAWKEGMEPSEIAEETYVVAGKIAAGNDHTLALKLDGSVISWGLGTYGRLGSGSTANRTTPQPISNLTDIIDLAAGATHSLAVRADGTLRTFGRNNFGQLGFGNTSDQLSPAALQGISDVIAVAAGENFSLVLREESGLQKVYAAGNPASGRLGLGSTSGNYYTFSNAVQKSTGGVLTGIQAIAAGQTHGLAVHDDQTLWTWGNGASGRLGTGGTANQTTAVQVLSDETHAATGNVAGQPLKNIVAIACGQAHSVAVDKFGFVWGWGRNTSGELAQGNLANKNRAVRLQIEGGGYFADAVHVTAGADFTVVTRADGTLWATGGNTGGSLGVGASGTRKYLTQVVDSNGNPLADVAFAAAGSNFSVALSLAGEIFTWGNAAAGTLGNGVTTGNRNSAHQLPDLTLANRPPVISLAASGSASAPANDVMLTATVSDPDDQAVKVDFYFGDVLIASKASPPYVVSLSNIGINGLGVGKYGFRAEANDLYAAKGIATASHVVRPQQSGENKTVYRRGLDTAIFENAVVASVDFVRGVELTHKGFEENDYPLGLPWLAKLDQQEEFPDLIQVISLASNTVNAVEVANPIVAFGKESHAGEMALGKEYRFAVLFAGGIKNASGAPLGYNQFLIKAYRKDTGVFVGQKEFRLPLMGDAFNPTDIAKWESFVRNGYSWPTPEYPEDDFFGLRTKFEVVQWNDNEQLSSGIWETPYPGYILTHTSESDEYGYIVSRKGFFPILGSSPRAYTAAAYPAGGQSNQHRYLPMYAMDFSVPIAWRSNLIDRYHFQGKAMPPHYAGKSLMELMRHEAEINLVTSPDPVQYTGLNHSQELRRNSELDAFVSSLTENLATEDEIVVALTNYVMNEVELCDMVGWDEGGLPGLPSINPGGVRRGAYAVYMEGQGSPIEQCALLVYMLRQAGIPSAYIYPEYNSLFMLDSRLSTLLGTKIRGAIRKDGLEELVFDPDEPFLVPCNYPWVSAYIGGEWAHLFPWLKDIEIEQGYNLYSLMPEGYKSGMAWIQKYLNGDLEIESFAEDQRYNPAYLFPLFVDQKLRQSGEGLSLTDVGIKRRQRKHYRTELGQFPRPFEIAGSPLVVESLKDRPAIFDTLQIRLAIVGANGEEVGATEAGGLGTKNVTTAEIPLPDLHNRRLLVMQNRNTTNTNQIDVRLILDHFDEGISGTGSFDGSLGNMGKRQQIQITPRFLNNVSEKQVKISMQLRSQRNYTRPDVNTPEGLLLASLGPYLAIHTEQILNQDSLIEKGDLAAICINYGKVSARMTEKHARKFWATPGSTNPEIFAGIPVYLAGMTLYKKESQFSRMNEELHGLVPVGNFGLGISALGAKRNDSGNLVGMTVSLEQPYLDMYTKKITTIGNNTSRSDSGLDAWNRDYRNASNIEALAFSAFEHLTLDEFYSSEEAVSSVRLLKTANESPNEYPGGFYVLNRTNYANFSQALSQHDPAFWAPIQEDFQGEDAEHLTVFITSEPVVGSEESYRGMGSLEFGFDICKMRISKNLNGGVGSQTSLFSSIHAPYLSLQRTPDSNYFLETLPFASSYSTPVLLAPQNISYHSIYSTFKAYNAGAYAPSSFDLDFYSQANHSLNLGLGSMTSSQNLGGATWAVLNQGFAGISYFTGMAEKFVYDPVDIITGAFYHDEVDLVLPGPMPLEIRRNYNSRNIAPTDFGYGWRPAFVPYLIMMAKEGTAESDPVSKPSADIYAAEMDGSIIVYSRVGTSDIWRPNLEKNPQMGNVWGEELGGAVNMRNAQIVKTGSTLSNTAYTLYSPDGSVRVFRINSYPIPGTLPSGIKRLNRKRAYLDTWTDNRGNSFTFYFGTNNSFPDYGLLKKVVSSSGMSVGFNYDTFGRIVEAHTNDGRWLYYSYNQYGDLESVTRPDGSVFRYQYKLESDEVGGKTQWTSTHLISRETRPGGRILENIYDSDGRVTEQKATVGEGSALVTNGKFEYYNAENADKTLSGYTIVKDAFDRPTRYDYASSQVSKITDAKNQETVYEWYGVDETTNGAYPRSLKSKNNPRGLLAEFKYNDYGNLVSKTLTGDLTGDGGVDTAVTTIISDMLVPSPPMTVYIGYRLRSVRDPSDNIISYLYGDTNQKYQPTSIRHFKGASIVSRTTREYGNVGSGAISAKGVLMKESVAAASTDTAVTEYEYDNRGFPTKTIRRTGTSDPDVVVETRYNLRGELAELTDADGRKTGYAYDGLGRRIWEEKRDENGLLFWWNYNYFDGNGEVTWTDGPRYYPEDYVWRRYDGGGRLIEETAWRSQGRADGSGVEALEGQTDYASTHNKYNAFGDLLITVDPHGFASSMSYDDIGQMLTRTRHSGDSPESPVLAQESYTYEPGGEVGIHIDVLGGVTSNSYTSRGQLKHQQLPDGRVFEWRYQLDGRVEQEVLPNGNIWHTSYDDLNCIVTRTLKTGDGTTLATEIQKFDRRGNVTETTDALGHVFTKSYDGLNRVKSEVGPTATTNSARRTKSFTYGVSDKLLIETNGLGESIVTVTDVIGRPARIEVKDAGSATIHRTAYSYTPDHHSYTMEQGSGEGSIKTTTYTDIQGSEVLTRYANSAYTLTRYDKMGNPISSRDEMGRETTRTFDALNHLDVETLPGGAVVNHDFDAAGNRVRREMPGGRIWSAQFDNASRMEWEQLSADGNAVRRMDYMYHLTGNAVGLLHTETDARGVVKTHAYDNRRRLQTLTTTGPLAEHAMTLTYGYNTRDDLTSVSQSGGGQQSSLVSLTPDAYGATVSEVVTLNGTAHSSLTQYWDAAGRRWKFEPTGQPASARTFTYRADGLMTGTALGATSFSYTYGTNGLPITRGGAGRTRTVASRDNLGRPTELVTSVGTNAVLTEMLTWCNDSTLNSYNAQRTGTGAWNELRVFGYDGAKRLIVEPYTPPGSAAASLGYAFDFGQTNGIGVRTLANLTGSQTGSWQVPPGQVNAFGRVLQETGSGSLGTGMVSNDYDAMGNVSSRSLPGGKTQTLKWDGLGRLMRVEDRDGSNNGFNWVAHYDGLGRRLKTAYQAVSSGTATGGISEVASVFDPQIEFLEVEVKQGANTWSKIYGPDAEGGYGLQQGVGGLEAVVSSNGTVSIPILDYSGHVGGWVSAGTANWTAATRSLAYGPAPETTPVVFEQNTANFIGSLNWQGRRVEPTGLIWMGARYYEPKSGRFVSADPYGHGASLSLYDYANGDPVNFIDADGRLGKGVASGWNGNIGAGSPDSLAFSAGLMFGGAASGAAEGVRPNNMASFYTENGLLLASYGANAALKYSPAAIIGTNHDPTAYGVGLEWMAGTGRDRTFGSGQTMTTQLQQTQYVQNARIAIQSQLNASGSALPLDFGRVAGEESELSYAKGAINDIFGFGITPNSNPTRGYLGSFQGTAQTISTVDPSTGQGIAFVTYVASNSSSLVSGFRKNPSGGGYTSDKTWIPVRNNMFGENGPYHSVSQTFQWSEVMTFQVSPQLP